MSSEVCLKVEGLAKSFGDLQAVSDLSFELRAGEVLGFIGANGAGKTTSMRMIASLELSDAGRVFVGGEELQSSGRKLVSQIGWMPDHYGTYQHMTVADYLDFFARAYGYKARERKRRVQDVMEFTDLLELRDRQISNLSKGMGQRLCLGRTLIHDPSVLLLDEPAAGLDPKARIDFKHLVRLLAEEGKAILISSHILSELEDMCDSILFINSGRVVHHGSSTELRKGKAGESIIDVRISSELQSFREFISLRDDAELVEALDSGFAIRLANIDKSEHLSEFLSEVVKAGHRVFSFSERVRRLEEAFVEILEGPGIDKPNTDESEDRTRPFLEEEEG